MEDTNNTSDVLSLGLQAQPVKEQVLEQDCADCREVYPLLTTSWGGPCNWNTTHVNNHSPPGPFQTLLQDVQNLGPCSLQTMCLAYVEAQEELA